MTEPRNPAEAFIARVARHSFLSLWSYANPRGRAGKELCDVLAVCDPDVLIISVKNTVPTRSGDLGVDWERWKRRAIEASEKQIYGAERWLGEATCVIRQDGSQGISLPSLSQRRVHRIAVALGSTGTIPVKTGDFGRGFVHVFTEEAIETVFRELDTVEDLTEYLCAKEAFLQGVEQVLLAGGERDLLATYLIDGRRFPSGYEHVQIGDGIWGDFTSRSEYAAKKEADRISYAWDRLVDRLAEDILHGEMEFGGSLDQNELAIRMMARESRLARRLLGRKFAEFLDLAREKKVRARLVPSISGIIYVFLATPHGCEREARVAELANRCFVARGRNPMAHTVVGVGTQRPELGQGFSLDVVYLNLPQWLPKHQQMMEAMQAELGYFVRPVVTRFSEDEYPGGYHGGPPV